MFISVVYNRFFLMVIFLLLLSCKEETENPFKGNNPNIPVYIQAPDENSSSAELHNYATTQWGKGNYEQALRFFTIAYEKANKENDYQQKAQLLNNIGLTYWKLGDLRLALDNYKEAGSLAEKYNLNDLLALTYTNRSLILREEEAYKSAKIISSKAIEILKEKGISRDLAIVYNNHGQIFKEQGEMDSAKIYYQKALSIYDTIDYKDGKSATSHNLAEIYTYYESKEKAIYFAYKALELGLKSESAVRISEGYKSVSDVFKHFSVLDSALIYYHRYTEFQEEQFKKNSANKLLELQTNLGYELQKLKIENLEKEQKLSRNRMWMILGGILILGLVLFLFLYKRNASVELKKQQLQKDLEYSQNVLQIKQEELKSYILDLSEKNNRINELQNELSKLSVSNSNEMKIAELLNSKILTDEDWEKFKSKFNSIYPFFIPKIKLLETNITEAETRYLVLHHLNLSPKEMASVLGISAASIHTCKMRLKRKLQQEDYDSVEEFVSE